MKSVVTHWVRTHTHQRGFIFPKPLNIDYNHCIIKRWLWSYHMEFFTGLGSGACSTKPVFFPQSVPLNLSCSERTLRKSKRAFAFILTTGKVYWLSFLYGSVKSHLFPPHTQKNFFSSISYSQQESSFK